LLDSGSAFVVSYGAEVKGKSKTKKGSLMKEAL
jgi:hypothetical protein